MAEPTNPSRSWWPRRTGRTGTDVLGTVLVIGLGRFGSSLSHTLVAMGIEVLGVDEDEDLVERHKDVLTHVVSIDATDERALRQIGAHEAQTAVVAIGTDIEASTLTTVALVDLGIPNVWAKAINEPHAKILQRVGAHHVVRPEADMGQRVAHLLSGTVIEYLALDEQFVIVEMTAPEHLVGISLGEAGLRAAHRVTVVCFKPTGGSFTYAERDTVLGAGDLIVVAGHRVDVDRFSNT